MSFWDNPDLKVGGDYIKFERVGDTVTGRILTMRSHRFDDGGVAPQLVLEVGGDEKTLTAGQVKLKEAFQLHRPEVGDVVTITLTDVERRAGGKTLKMFDVSVVRGGDPAAAAAQPAMVAPRAAPAPAPIPAAQPAGMTPEQAAALKAAGL